MKKTKYTTTRDFIKIALAYNCNVQEIFDNNRDKYDDISSIRQRIRDYRKKGLLPLDSGNTVSTGELLSGTSTLYDEDGKVKLQWVKTNVEANDKLQAFKTALDSLLIDIEPIEPIKENENTEDDKLTIYTIGDAHIGMLAWGKESGEDHDIAIAEKDLITATHHLISQSIPTTECFIIDVGDYFHSDNFEGKTARGGNILDVDGRYPKVLEIGLRITTELINLALGKHSKVRWRSAIGNHNEHSAIMISAFIKAYYRNEPRVIVHDTPNMFMYHIFGKNLIGVTHGHTAKAEALGDIMAIDAKEYWSQSEYRYWYTGHIHHQSVKEFRSCVVETFRTLASKDAWHSSSGYRSGQSMKSIVLGGRLAEQLLV